jgi:hypothetical protein
VLFV